VSLTWAGYLLGRRIPNIDQHIHVVVAIVIVLSVLPIGLEWWKARSRAKQGSVVADP
jgi:membrane-associated protein